MQHSSNSLSITFSCVGQPCAAFPKELISKFTYNCNSDVNVTVSALILQMDRYVKTKLNRNLKLFHSLTATRCVRKSGLNLLKISIFSNSSSHPKQSIMRFSSSSRSTLDLHLIHALLQITDQFYISKPKD